MNKFKVLETMNVICLLTLKFTELYCFHCIFFSAESVFIYTFSWCAAHMTFPSVMYGVDLVFCRTILKESGFARYLHSAVLINGAMLIFGGNTHNDTSLSNGAKCFSADFLAYDIGMYFVLFLTEFKISVAFKCPANAIL